MNINNIKWKLHNKTKTAKNEKYEEEMARADGNNKNLGENVNREYWIDKKVLGLRDADLIRRSNWTKKEKTTSCNRGRKISFRKK